MAYAKTAAAIKYSGMSTHLRCLMFALSRTMYNIPIIGIKRKSPWYAKASSMSPQTSAIHARVTPQQGQGILNIR